MAFELYQNEQLSIGIQRLLKEETGQVITHLSSFHDKHLSIHEARKGHKKIRAILRMARPTIGETRFKQENIFYRDNARVMSEIRDAIAIQEALDELSIKYHGVISVDVIEAVKRFLENQQSWQVTDETNLLKIMSQAKGQIIDFQNQTQELPISGDQFELIEKGIRKVYRRGMKGLHRTHRIPNMEHLHDWRKRVKYLYYIVQVLCPVWPNLMNPLASELDALSDKQGLWRDLGLLESKLQPNTSLKLPDEEFNDLIDSIHTYQNELLNGSFDLGFRIYRESPKNFTYRLKGYWEQWKGLGFSQNDNSNLMPTNYEAE